MSKSEVRPTTTKQIIKEYNSLPADISQVEWVLYGEYDSIKKENALLIEEAFSRIGLQALLEKENEELKRFVDHFGLSSKMDEFNNELKMKKENGCTCPPKKNDGSTFDGISYGCKLHGR